MAGSVVTMVVPGHPATQRSSAGATALLLSTAITVGLVGKESDIFRRAMPQRIALLNVLCLLVGIQPTPILSWTLP